MTLSSYLKRRLSQLLADHGVLVWYDEDRVFGESLGSLSLPNCAVISAGDSILEARRSADAAYRFMNESSDPAAKERRLLIHVPRRRGAAADKRITDPFEAYAIAGTAFGDTEDEQLESLARQAMPEKAAEITRLFAEGRPSLALLDSLESVGGWPVLKDIFHTETPVEIISAALCDPSAGDRLDSASGLPELKRLLEGAVGFRAGGRSKKWESLQKKVFEYVLFSEFAFDLPEGLPASLCSVPHAAEESRSEINSICDRMRSIESYREVYVSKAISIESDLRLEAMMPKEFDPGVRDTFPFEERQLLRSAASRLISADHESVASVIEQRKKSVWRYEPARSPSWTTLERALALVDACSKAIQVRDLNNTASVVEAYTSGGLHTTDKHYRLFENAFTSCDDDVLDPVALFCRTRYLEFMSGVQQRFLSLIERDGWPPEGMTRQSQVFDRFVAPALERREKTAFFMVDSLRYEMGRDLCDILAGIGEAASTEVAGCLPTITSVGMAALLPGADGGLDLQCINGELVPRIGRKPLKTPSDRMKVLADLYGDRFASLTLGDFMDMPKKAASKLMSFDLLVVRTQDPDEIGENLGGWQARKQLSGIVGDLAAAARKAAVLGFTWIVFATDHGHVMLNEVPPGDVVQPPPGDWCARKRRVLLGSSHSRPTGAAAFRTSHVGMQSEIPDICFPLGYRVFSDGSGYFHGGLSLQEAVLPIVTIRASSKAVAQPGKPDIEIRYKSDRYTSRVIGLKLFLQGDILASPRTVRVEAYTGDAAAASLVGEAADCDARDDRTGTVTLQANEEIPVPVLINPDYAGEAIEIRVIDPETRIVWVRRTLKNSSME